MMVYYHHMILFWHFGIILFHYVVSLVLSLLLYFNDGRLKIVILWTYSIINISLYVCYHMMVQYHVHKMGSMYHDNHHLILLTTISLLPLLIPIDTMMAQYQHTISLWQYITILFHDMTWYEDMIYPIMILSEHVITHGMVQYSIIPFQYGWWNNPIMTINGIWYHDIIWLVVWLPWILFSH